MRPIKNPFKHGKREDYQCFGCSPYNAIGLKLQFFEEAGTVLAEWEPDGRFEGYLNMLHGGIQATMHDEIASWTVYTQCDTAGVTSGLNVSYHRPVYLSSGKIKLRAKVTLLEERKAVIHTELINSKEQVCSSAVAEYYLFPKEIARKKYHYPGKAAFLDKDNV